MFRGRWQDVGFRCSYEWFCQGSINLKRSLTHAEGVARSIKSETCLHHVIMDHFGPTRHTQRIESCGAQVWLRNTMQESIENHRAPKLLKVFVESTF